jgi:hypothetical protein
MSLPKGVILGLSRFRPAPINPLPSKAGKSTPRLRASCSIS